MNEKLEKTNKNKKEMPGLKEIMENREEFETKNVLLDIKEKFSSNEDEILGDTVDTLLFNKDRIENSTILRGPTYNGQGVGQAMLWGSLDGVITPQVFVQKMGEPEFVSQFKMVAKKYEETDFEKYARTVVHELLHTFTRYITATHEMGKIEKLNDLEVEFYAEAKKLHEDFLAKNKTGDSYLDKFDEYIVKSLSSGIGGVYYNKNNYLKMKKLFDNLYKNNPRLIISYSKYLQNNK